MKTGRGCCDRSALLSVDGLIAFAIAGRIRARDIRRKWDVANAIERSEEIFIARNGQESDAALAELRAGQNLGLQFVLQFVLHSKKKALADADLAAGGNQAFPIVGLNRKLPREQDLDTAAKEILGGRILRTDGLRARALAMAVEPRRKNAGVVEDDEIGGPQPLGKVAEEAIGILSAGPLHVQHAGGITRSERILRNEFVGKMEVEDGDEHPSDYRRKVGRCRLATLGGTAEAAVSTRFHVVFPPHSTSESSFFFNLFVRWG